MLFTQCVRKAHTMQSSFTPTAPRTLVLVFSQKLLDFLNGKSVEFY